MQSNRRIILALEGSDINMPGVLKLKKRTNKKIALVFGDPLSYDVEQTGADHNTDDSGQDISS